MYIVLHLKYRLLLSDFNTIQIRLDRFSKNTKIWNLMNNPSGVSWAIQRKRADRQTDMTYLTVRFRNCAIAAENGLPCVYALWQHFPPLSPGLDKFSEPNRRLVLTPHCDVRIGGAGKNITLRRSTRDNVELIICCPCIVIYQTNSVALVRERTIPTERPPPVGEVSTNFCG
jgi:hypothetical protein